MSKIDHTASAVETTKARTTEPRARTTSERWTSMRPRPRLVTFSWAPVSQVRPRR